MKIKHTFTDAEYNYIEDLINETRELFMSERINPAIVKKKFFKIIPYKSKVIDQEFYDIIEDNPFLYIPYHPDKDMVLVTGFGDWLLDLRSMLMVNMTVDLETKDVNYYNKLKTLTNFPRNS